MSSRNWLATSAAGEKSVVVVAVVVFAVAVASANGHKRVRSAGRAPNFISEFRHCHQVIIISIVGL
jgi:hypothetical protein